jgi:hypothetical protein
MYARSSLSRRNFAQQHVISPGPEKSFDPVRDGYSYRQSYHDAYTNPILVHTTPVQLSDAGPISSSVPFKMPLRNASYRLDIDPNRIKFVPRNSNYPRVVGVFSEDRVALPKSGTCGAGAEGDILEKYSDALLRKDREVRERDEADKRKEDKLKDKGYTCDEDTGICEKTGPSKAEKEETNAKEVAKKTKEAEEDALVEAYFNRHYANDSYYRIVTVNGRKEIQTWTAFTGWTRCFACMQDVKDTQN